MAIKIRKKKKKRSRNPSYKGGKYLIIKPYTVDIGDKYHIKYPKIDKITLLGNAHFNNPSKTTQEIEKEKTDFKKFLYGLSKATERGEDIDYPLEWHSFKNSEDYMRSRYKHHFRIKPPNSENYALLSFQPLYGKNQRFLKLEFNPSKLGPYGVEYIKEWYDIHLVHSTYKDLVSEKKCIGKLDIAIDIVGIDIADLIINYKTKGKSQRYHSTKGLLESYYPYKALKGALDKPTDIKIYVKERGGLESDELEDDELDIEEEDPNSEHGVELPSAHHFSSNRKRKRPITRVEKTIETIRPLTELHKLKPHFKTIKVFLPWLILDKKDLPESEHHWQLFLDSVRWRGLEYALLKLPRPLRKKHETLLSQNIANIFEVFSSSENWRDIWTKSIERSNLLP